MASAQVVETSVNTNNSPQNYTSNPDDRLNHNKKYTMAGPAELFWKWGGGGGGGGWKHLFLSNSLKFPEASAGPEWLFLSQTYRKHFPESGLTFSDKCRLKRNWLEPNNLIFRYVCQRRLSLEFKEKIELTLSFHEVLVFFSAKWPSTENTILRHLERTP